MKYKIYIVDPETNHITQTVEAKAPDADKAKASVRKRRNIPAEWELYADLQREVNGPA